MDKPPQIDPNDPKAIAMALEICDLVGYTYDVLISDTIGDINEMLVVHFERFSPDKQAAIRAICKEEA